MTVNNSLNSTVNVPAYAPVKPLAGVPMTPKTAKLIQIQFENKYPIPKKSRRVPIITKPPQNNVVSKETLQNVIKQNTRASTKLPVPVNIPLTQLRGILNEIQGIRVTANVSQSNTDVADLKRGLKRKNSEEDLLGPFKSSHLAETNPGGDNAEINEEDFINQFLNDYK